MASQPPTIIKTYEMHKTSIFKAGKLEIHLNGQTILLSNSHTTWKGPRVDIMLPDNSIIAACKPKSMGPSQTRYLILGNPDDADKDKDKAGWPELTRDSFSGSKYGFAHSGREFTWTRTHDKALGGRTLGNRDFKLVDQSTGSVLAVWINNNAFLKRNPAARLDYYADLGQELELLSLVAILGIEDHIRRANNNSAAASGGAGA